MERWSNSPETPGAWGAVKLMGIVNVTPDSFSDGGEYLDPDLAVAHALELAAEGADILDIGGESTRPGAAPVPEDEELRRVIPVIERLATTSAAPATGIASSTGATPSPAADAVTDEPTGPPTISVDTSKLKVAEAALAAGAAIINDVTAMRNAPEIADLCAEQEATVVLMHMQGTPETMQRDPRYGDVVAEVKAFLAERAQAAVDAGIDEDRIWLDPGIGFGKTREHNLELLARLSEIADLGRTVLVGTSRKSFIAPASASQSHGAAALPGAVSDMPRPASSANSQQRLGGTIASGLAAAQHGANVLRVHDVAAMRQALAVATAIDRVP